MNAAIKEPGIGSLKEVPLPDMWRIEAEGFSIWLSEHLDVLAEHLGLKALSFKRAGRALEGSLFSADIMALDDQSRTVVIETQLEKADYDHLGKVLSYARTLRAGVVVWISTDPLSEHKKIIDWLNRNDSRIDFYLVRIDAVRIDDSPIAPRFATIAGPDAELKKTAPTGGRQTRIRFMQATRSKRAGMLKRIAVALLTLGTITFFTLYQAYHRASRPPDNSPLLFLEQERPEDKKIVVTIGDDITHGNFSYNYVDLLAEELDRDRYHFVNAGMNGDLAYNVLQRLEDVILCRPDYITILIGTNDVRASFSSEHRDWAVRMMELPEPPTKSAYSRDIRKIVRTLKKRTNAKVALLSLPPIGQRLQHSSFKRAEEYSRAIERVAREERVYYLPLNEKMGRYLERRQQEQHIAYPRNLVGELALVYGSILRLYVLGEGLDEQAAKRGLLLSSDLIHLNSRGAEMVAGLIGDFLLRTTEYAPPGRRRGKSVKIAYN